MKTGVRYLSTAFKLKGNKTTCHIFAFINIPGFGNLYEANENVQRLFKMLTKEHKIEMYNDGVSIRVSESVICHESDVYDEQKGKRLAQLKAQGRIFFTSAWINEAIVQCIAATLMPLSMKAGQAGNNCVKRMKNIVYPEQQTDIALDQCSVPVEEPDACPCGCDCKDNEGCTCEHCVCEADAVPEWAQTENA
jgi:hypothetical protein